MPRSRRVKCRAQESPSIVLQGYRIDFSRARLEVPRNRWSSSRCRCSLRPTPSESAVIFKEGRGISRSRSKHEAVKCKNSGKFSRRRRFSTQQPDPPRPSRDTTPAAPFTVTKAASSRHSEDRTGPAPVSCLLARDSEPRFNAFDINGAPWGSI